MTIDKKFLSIFGIAILSFFSTLWVRPADLMEARNFISAREIVMNNEWLVTTLNGAYRFEKPPLPTWLTALTMEITQNFSDEWILRIPVAIICVLLALYMYKFVDEFVHNKNIAFLSSFVLCTTFMVTKVGAENAWDAYPYVFMFISLYYLVRILHTNAMRFVFPAAFFLACSLLSKGPVAPYGMLLPFCISYCIVYRFEYIKKSKGKLLLYFGLGIALAMLWPMAMMIENADLFISVMLKEENTWSHRHVQPFFFYLHFIGFMGIWAIFTLFALGEKWRLHEIINPKDEQDKFFQFGRMWAILTLILLSIIKMKKERYGLPIYIELVLPVSILLYQYTKTAWEKLKNIEQKAFIAQFFCIVVASIGAVAIIIWKADTVVGKLLLPIPFLGILAYMLPRYKRDNDALIKSVIYCSGILLLFINSNVTWIIEHHFRSVKHPEIPALEEFCTADLQAPVYGQDFSIMAVWNLGQSVLPLDITKPLPTEFYIVGNFDALPDGYAIVSQKTYRKRKNKDGTILFSKIKAQ